MSRVLVAFILCCCTPFGEAPPTADAGGATGYPGAPVFDGASSGETPDGSSLTFSHAVAPGTNRLLVVASHVASSTYETAKVTYSGIALMKIGPTVEAVTPGEDCTTTLWYLVDPPVGTGAVVANLAGAARPMVAFAMSFHGVHPVKPIAYSGHAVGASAPASSATVPVTSAPGELIVDSLCLADLEDGLVSAGPGQTERARLGGASGALLAVGSTMPGAPSGTTTWSFGGAYFTLSAVALRPAAP